MRPTILGTVFPVVAFVVGVAVGAFLPPGIIPGTGPNKPDGTPKGPPPTPVQAFETLWKEITGGMASAANKSGGGGSSNSTNTGGSGSTTAPGDPRTPEAIAAEQARRRQDAMALNHKPLLLAGVHDGRTLVVQAADGTRRNVVLKIVDVADPQIAEQLKRFVGERVSLDLAEPVVDEQGQLVAVVHVLPRNWQPTDGAPTDDRYSLNAAVYRALNGPSDSK